MAKAKKETKKEEKKGGTCTVFLTRGNVEDVYGTVDNTVSGKKLVCEEINCKYPHDTISIRFA